MGKLHDRMQEDLLLKAYSPHTQRAYLGCARHFARHYLRSPEKMGEQEIRGFLLHLVRDRQASRPRWACTSTPSSSSTTSPSSDPRKSRGSPIPNGPRPSRSF